MIYKDPWRAYPREGWERLMVRELWPIYLMAALLAAAVLLSLVGVIPKDKYHKIRHNGGEGIQSVGATNQRDGPSPSFMEDTQ